MFKEPSICEGDWKIQITTQKIWDNIRIKEESHSWTKVFEVPADKTNTDLIVQMIAREIFEEAIATLKKRNWIEHKSVFRKSN